MPYYGDGAPYYYSSSSSGPFANHSSLMSSIGRYHNPIAARYSPHLSTISETPFVTLRRYSPAVPTSATTSLSRPRRVIDTADIDVSKPPSRNLEHRHQQHRLRRDRPTIKIRSQALKDNPALREYNERHEKTVGEMLVEKFLIKDKNAAKEPPRIKLYHQASLTRGDLSKERENEILAAIRHRITRKMTRRRSSVDAIPLDPEQIEREAALQAAQAEALDTLVAEELAEAEIEVRKGTFTKRHSLVPLSLEISEASESEDEADEEELKSSEAERKHATAKKKRRRKSIDKYSQSDNEEEDTFSIAESIIEEEEFEWDDREKCDDIKKIIPKDVCEMKVPEQKRAVSPRMEKKEKLDEVGNRLKELRKEVRKLDKKERDSRGEKKEEKVPKIEEMEVDIVKPKAEKIVPKLNELKVDEVKVIPELKKTEEVLKEEKIDELEQMKTDIVESKVDELKKEVTPEKVTPRIEEMKKEPAKVKKDDKKKETEPSKKHIESIKVEEVTPEKVTPKTDEIKKEPAKLKEDEKKKKIDPLKRDVDTIKVEEVTPEKVTPKTNEMKKESAKLKKDEKKKETETLKEDLDTVKIEETKILERKDQDKNLRSDKSDVKIVVPAKDVRLEPKKVLDTEDKDDTSKLHKDDTTTSKTTDPALDKRSETPESKLKVKERKVKEKSPKPDRSKLKRTTSAPQQLPLESESPQGFKVEACNSVGDFSTLYVKAAASAEAQRSIEQFRESIRLPAPKSRTTVETEVVLPVRKPYVRDTSRNSVYLALKPTRKEVEDAKTPAVISEEGENVDRIDDDRRVVVVDKKGSRAQDGGKEEFVSWWDDNEDEKIGVKKVGGEKKVEVEESENIVEKKPEVKALSKVKVEPVVEKKIEVSAEKKTVTNKVADKVVETVDKKLEEKTTVDKKITEKVPDPVVEKKTEKIVEPAVEKKSEVEKKTTEKTVESVIEKKLELKAEKEATEKIVEPVVEKRLEVKAEKKTFDKIVEPVLGKKLETTTEKKTIDKIVEPVVEKKLEVKKVGEQKADIKLDLKLQGDKKTTEHKPEVKPKNISIKPRIDDKSTTDKRPKTPTKAAAKEVTSESPQPESQKKSSALPSIDDNDKTITRTHDSETSSDVTHIADNDEETIIEASAKRDERKRKVDAAAIMKIEKRILEEAESPDKILTSALPSIEKKEDDEEAEQKVGLDETKKKSSTTEIDFWSEPTDSLQQPTSVESELQQTKNLKLDLTRIEDSVTDDLPTPLVKDKEKTPLVEEAATPLAENLNEVPAVNLQLTEEERRSTVRYNGVKEEEQVDELSGTVKKISKWGNHDNLTSLDSNVTPVASKDVSPAVSTTSSVTKKKIVKKKKSTTTKKTGEGATKKTGESTNKTSAKTKTPVKKTAAATPQPAAAKSSAMSASGSSARNTPVQRPTDLQKLFYTTPAILLTATPRDLRKVRRAKAKKKKPPTRTPSLSSDSTGSTRSTATTSTEEGSNCEEDAEQKRLNSTRSNDSGFDGSPRLSNCDMVCHKKCEKLTGNLCGLNQKLVAEALQALKKGPTYHRAGRKSFVRRRLRPYGYGFPADPYEQLPPHESPSQSSENQRNADGDHFHHGSGRITPPATNLPRFKKYEVTDFNFLKVLGKGSFGKVLLAELRGTECVYAVKCLKKDVVLEDDDVECTLIERKVLTLATRHPYLCHLFCTFQTESHLFFVMEYLNGGDLMFHIQKSGRFTEPRAKFYAAEIWSGLIFLHKKGIVYRDLKLDNVLLDFEGHIRIADFGMCKLQIFLDRTADTFCGTPDYMAPEIIKGLKYNQAVDWWSFGVLLYEMLTGQSPFSGCDEDELFWSICNERPFIPRYLSQSSTDILVCLLEKDAGKRIPGHEIACHPFFCNIAWDKLERRVLEPPFKPAVEHTLDTRYFDTAFTTERPRLTPVPEEILTSMDQAVFRGFSYTNPNATD